MTGWLPWPVWHEDAACAGAEPGLFEDLALDDAEVQAEALQHCRACPVMQECGQWAARDRFTGVAGGRVFKNGRPLMESTRLARLRRGRDVA